MTRGPRQSLPHPGWLPLLSPLKAVAGGENYSLYLQQMCHCKNKALPGSAVKDKVSWCWRASSEGSACGSCVPGRGPGSPHLDFGASVTLALGKTQRQAAAT